MYLYACAPPVCSALVWYAPPSQAWRNDTRTAASDPVSHDVSWAPPPPPVAGSTLFTQELASKRHATRHAAPEGWCAHGLRWSCGVRQGEHRSTRDGA